MHMEKKTTFRRRVQQHCEKREQEYGLKKRPEVKEKHFTAENQRENSRS